MYLRTPKRYTRGQRRSPISLRWVWLWIMTPVVVFVGIQVYNRRAEFAPPVEQAINSAINSVQSGIATVVAPTATPTEDPSSKIGLAESDWREGRIESAVNNYELIARAMPNDVLSHFRLAFGLVMQGRMQEALVAAESAVTANPFSSDAWAVQAIALDRNQRYGEAISSAMRALEIDPSNARAMAFLAESYFDNGNYDLALSTSNRALEADPASFEALRARGLVAQGYEYDLDAARQYYQEAYNYAPNMPYLAVDLANILFAQNNLSDALSILNDVVELNPKNALALYWLGNMYYRGEGNFSQANEMLQRCVDANPESISCNGLLGRVKSSLDDNEGAARFLQRAVDLGSLNSYHHFWLARAQRALGNCSGAIPNLERARELAQTANVTDVLTAADELLRECQVAMGIAQPLMTPTPEVTEEASS